MIYLLLTAICCYLFRECWKAWEETTDLEKKLAEAKEVLCKTKRDHGFREKRLHNLIEGKQNKIRELQSEVRNLHDKYKAEKQSERYSLGALVGLKPKKTKEVD